jgi:micrococcal nuclease
MSLSRTAILVSIAGSLLAVFFFVVKAGESESYGPLNDGVFRSTGREPQPVKVLRVVDGDTLRVRLHGENVRVRLLGIDAPEVSHNSSAAECFGDEATRELQRLTPAGSAVTLTPDSAQPLADRYDRLLRYVDHDGVDVGKELLRRGAAERYRNRPPLERNDDYDNAVKEARIKLAGLWASC